MKRPGSLLLTLVLVAALSSAASGGVVVISEVLYDAAGTDDGKTFVELHGPAGFDLSGYAVEGVNGSGGAVTHRVFFSSLVIPDDGFLVLADEASGGGTSVANADLLIASFDLQNGPDSVRLVKGSTVVDAVGYGSFGSGDVFAGEGKAAPSVGAGWSLARIWVGQDTGDNRTDFRALGTPTPGTGPTTVVVPSPQAASWGLLGFCLVALWVRRYSRKQ